LDVLQRRRNCIANAKYRRKKKQLELQKLQMNIKGLSIERERLLRRIGQLEDENRSIHKQLLAAAIHRK
jgi:hypothetical protein